MYKTFWLLLSCNAIDQLSNRRAIIHKSRDGPYFNWLKKSNNLHVRWPGCQQQGNGVVRILGLADEDIEKLMEGALV